MQAPVLISLNSFEATAGAGAANIYKPETRVAFYNLLKLYHHILLLPWYLPVERPPCSPSPPFSGS